MCLASAHGAVELSVVQSISGLGASSHPSSIRCANEIHHEPLALVTGQTSLEQDIAALVSEALVREPLLDPEDHPAALQPSPRPVRVLLRVHQMPKTLGFRQDCVWSSRLQSCLARVVQLRGISAWVSTLGGAFSALGDIRPAHAQRAKVLACQHYHIARRLGDSGLAERCLFFVALATLQQGRCLSSTHVFRSFCQSPLGAGVGLSLEVELSSFCALILRAGLGR